LRVNVTFLISGNSNGQAAVWLMDGLSVTAGANIGFNPGAAWHVVPQHQDLL
jgi:hypothetical protein